jgi:hypothetical protein
MCNYFLVSSFNACLTEHSHTKEDNACGIEGGTTAKEKYT